MNARCRGWRMLCCALVSSMCWSLPACVTDEEHVGQAEQEILRNYGPAQASASVRLEKFDGSTCSGTLVTNDIVLTARHCVAIGPCGPLMSPSTVTVFQHGPEEIAEPEDVSDVRAIAAPDHGSPCTDLALLRLEKRFSYRDRGNKRPRGRRGRSTQLASPSLPTDWMDGVALDWLGHGQIGCELWAPIATAAPQLGRGIVERIDYEDFEIADRTWSIAPFLYYDVPPTFPALSYGDSGGGSFYSFLHWAGHKLVGVHSAGDDQVCEIRSIARDVAVNEHRRWITSTIAGWSRDEARSFSSAGALGNFEQWFVGSRRGEPAWIVEGGELRETSNAYTSESGYTWGPTLIDRDQAVFNGMVEVWTKSTTDNDVQGLIQRARGRTDYYQLAAREQGGWVRLDKRSQLGNRRLAEVMTSVDWNREHHLQFVAVDDLLFGFIDGRFVISTRDMAANSYTAGSVGLMEHGQTQARFDDFKVTHAR